MLESKENAVKIEGILSEVDLKLGSFQKNGSTMESIGGVIKIRVSQKINSADPEPTELEIPVHMFASKLTNKGQPNPAYESIKRVMDDFVSIAASDIDHADRVRITRGQIQMNEYYGQTGNLVSFPRVSASFVTKVKKEDCKPEATFSLIFMVGKKGYETDADGVEIPNRYKIMAILPQYGGKVDVVPLLASAPGVINAVSDYWNQGDTIKANGRLNFTSRTETVTIPVDFGEPREETRTTSVSELIITGGSTTPLEGDFAFPEDDVQKALADRTARLADLKEKAAQKASQKGQSGKAPEGKFADLGF